MITLNHFLTLGAILFCIGLFGALSKRNIIAIMMFLELMTNAVNLSLISFSKYITPITIRGQIFAIFVMVVTAAEIGLGLAIVLCIYRSRETTQIDEVNLLKW